MNRIIATGLIFAGILLTGCSKNEVDIDMEYPEIDLSVDGAFPVQCSELVRGQKFTFKARFSDNQALGSYSLDIHHNFDHHTHSTEVNDCGLDPVKTPVKPMLLLKSYEIPPGQKSYIATQELEIPADIDPGDYHFMILLTDREGWQSMKGLSIKIK